MERELAFLDPSIYHYISTYMSTILYIYMYVYIQIYIHTVLTLLTRHFCRRWSGSSHFWISRAGYVTVWVNSVLQWKGSKYYWKRSWRQPTDSRSVCAHLRIDASFEWKQDAYVWGICICDQLQNRVSTACCVIKGWFKGSKCYLNKHSWRQRTGSRSACARSKFEVLAGVARVKL